MTTSKAISVNGNPWDPRLPLFDRVRALAEDPVMQRIQPKGRPVFHGDEDVEMGDATIHTVTVGILLAGLSFHFALRSAYRAFGNLNLYYSDNPSEYVSPDVMIVKPRRPLPAQISSYQVGPGTPLPLFVAEVLSPRTWQQGDLTRKPMIYSDLGIEEYLVADVTGEMLQQRLLLLRRRPEGGWDYEQDADGGITSRLGFRAVIEADGLLRVIDAKTGKRYIRPDEAQAAADERDTAVGERNAARERIRQLEEEVTRLRGTAPKAEPQSKKGKGRRRKP